MSAFFYSVTATIEHPAVAREYTEWLLHGHTDAVIRGGALSARVIRLDDESIRIETQYLFPSRGAFSDYEAGPAVELREEGRRLFAGRGVAFERRSGELLAD